MNEEYIFIICLVSLILVYRIIANTMRGWSGNDRKPVSEELPQSETELLREVHQGLARMEKRVEALETLLTGQEEARHTAAAEKRK